MKRIAAGCFLKMASSSAAATAGSSSAHHHHHHHRLIPSAASRRHLLMLSERDVQACLSMKNCLAVNRKALVALAQEGKAIVPTRIGLPYPPSSQSQPTDSSTTTTKSAATAAAAQDWTLFKPAAYYPHNQFRADRADTQSEQTGGTSLIPNNEHIADTVGDENDETTLMGIKIVSVRANNPARHKLPLVPATIVSVNAETGLVEAIVAGTYLTAARTAAGSALSTALVYEQKRKMRHLVNNNNNNNDTKSSLDEPPPLFQHLVVFGAGLQAKLHIQAIATAMSGYNSANSSSDDHAVSSHENDEQQQQHPHSMRITPIPLVSIINRSEQRALELKNEILGGANDDDCWAREAQTVLLDDKAAVAMTLSTANVVVTATNTIEPLWKDGGDDNDDEDDNRMMMLPRGCHITGVGSYTPQMREVPLSIVRKCHVYMDTPEARLVGDLKDLPDSHPMTLIGRALMLANDPTNKSDILAVDHRGVEEMDYTFFKSVGTAIQDVMTADMVVQRARELNIGQQVDMS